MGKERFELLREFKTAQFRVITDWTYDDDADLSFDETGETQNHLASGEWVCMLVRVRVIHDTLGELATDYLGSCIYETPAAFMDHKECARETRKLRRRGSDAVCGSYFADMIHETIREARAEVRRLAARDYPYVRATKE